MSQKKYAFIDGEFNGTREKRLNIVCLSILVDGVTHEFWTHQNPAEFERAYMFILRLGSEGYTFVAYNVESEASCFITLGLKPLEFNWLDLYLEYKMLQNHNHDLQYGKQYIGGKVKMTQPYGEKGKANLAAAVYKLCGKQIDTEHKTLMRDIIIRSDVEEIEANRTAIQAYCTSDITVLPELLNAIKRYYLKKIPANQLGLVKLEASWRAEYAVRTAMMVRQGYPINLEWTKNLTDSVPLVLRECQEDINAQFPQHRPFKFNPKTSRYSLDTKVCQAWIKKHHAKWDFTETGKISLALEAWEEHYHFRHEFPPGNFGAQMVRYLKLKQSIASFNFKAEADLEDTFWGYVGTDGMVRPYHNIYGAQSSRTQAKAKGFLFLKSAWVRSICQAPKGYAIGAIDYSSQEFLLSAVCSMDPEMLKGYKEGDVYLYYGKGIGMIPKHGTKATHGKERDLCKSTVLGLSYMMSKYGLSAKLTQDTGKLVDTEEAQELINKFDTLFGVFSEWRQKQIDHYQAHRYLKLADGWYMFGDNDNARSVGNVPLQGYGACIMRKAVQLAQDKGLNIIFTLHDALYIMFKSEDLSAMQTLRECMKEAFIYYFTGAQKEMAAMIRMDGKAWSNDWEVDEKIEFADFTVEKSKYHIDPRAKSEYNRFSKYLTTNPSLDLL